MADFKKIPDSDSGAGPFDAISAEMLGQFAATYWPVILGGITLFVLILKGNALAVIRVGIVVALLQAWRSGLLG